MLKRLLLLSVIILILCGVAFATGQEPDCFIYKDRQYSLLTNPLDFLYKNNPSIPQPNFSAISTANWRGYVATWEVIDHRLYLVDLDARINDAPAKIQDVFPDAKDGNVAADWFTGYLVVPTGELTDYVHMGYASLYSRYMLIKIINGEEKGVIECDTDGYLKIRAKQFQKYRETEEYKQLIEKFKQKYGDKFNKEEFDNFLLIYGTDYMTYLVD